MLKDRMRRWRQSRRMVRELNAYSERELAELGIARADIDRLALEATRT